jgi:hypothetical protein
LSPLWGGFEAPDFQSALASNEVLLAAQYIA